MREPPMALPGGARCTLERKYEKCFQNKAKIGKLTKIKTKDKKGKDKRQKTKDEETKQR